jgi:outer membrane biosynthesis protein TonB
MRNAVVVIGAVAVVVGVVAVVIVTSVDRTPAPPVVEAAPARPAPPPDAAPIAVAPPADAGEVQGSLLGSDPADLQAGLGRYGPIGHGTPTRDGYGKHPHDGAVPRVLLGKPTIQGGVIDANVVRRIIKRNVAKLLYCYEKRLLSIPTLDGTVSVRFTLGADGTVSSSQATGVDDEVASCVAGAIYALAFPRLTRGDLAIVTYPMTFHPTGG